ncbi:MAG: dihydroorotase [SAR86 cluster bacterium]|uniref:Dihydroorotase n=1 Tax=SAR86 cluster bacterium TaxID=2030880 RepID=A0A2A5AV57_9GAMM|nr:MAG: dihydroorotase [SAR86 cluster bacterium]
MSSDVLSIIQPDDWHLHFRDGNALATTVPHTAKAFARAIVMPNLKPPVTTVAEAIAYRNRILAAVPSGNNFQPLMTLYFTDQLTTAEIELASNNDFVQAVKYYPAGATTNSENGVTDIETTYPVIERMEELGLPLLIHGESTDSKVDIFDREKVFIDSTLAPLLARFPTLRVVLEHITTSNAVQFVEQQAANVAATITPHHLMYNRNDLLVGGVRPHFYCLPILKRNTHQHALLEAATGGNPKFFLGTDSAPHGKADKENSCGCAGIYSAPGALEMYTEIFDECGALDKLEGFASFFGADFYQLPRNQSRISLTRRKWEMAESFELNKDVVVPMRAKETINWHIVDATDEK